MRIGFIGAGKVGCSLGKYFASHGIELAGYFDQDRKAAEEAARFTDTRVYDDMQSLTGASDVIFLTVPDGLISKVFGELAANSGSTAGQGTAPEAATNQSAATGSTANRAESGTGTSAGLPDSGAGPAPAAPAPRAIPLAGKCICHCSGSISSREGFPGIGSTGAYGYSVHPLFAVSDRHETYRELGGAFFSLEGDPERLDDMAALLTKAGLTFQIIDPASKTKYHLAAVYASNLICGLIGEADRLLQECGFAEGDALKALTPLIAGNVEHALAAGPVKALTGPVERGDVTTLRKHLSVCETEEDRQLYRLLSRKLLRLAREKHPERDYRELTDFLDTASTDL